MDPYNDLDYFDGDFDSQDDCFDDCFDDVFDDIDTYDDGGFDPFIG